MSQRSGSLESIAFSFINNDIIGYERNPSSGGIWAPDLSYADGKFWLVYTDVKVVDGAFKDMTNYLTTATDIKGSLD